MKYKSSERQQSGKNIKREKQETHSPKQDNLVFGLHTIKTLLKREPERILELYLGEDRKDTRIKEIVDLIKHHQLSVQYYSKSQLDKLSGFGVHQGVIAKIRHKSALDEAEFFNMLKIKGDNREKYPALILVLDGVQDPHNLGACLRTADAAGVMAVVIPKDRAVGLTPVALKAASGADLTVPVVTVTNLVRFLKELKDLGFWIAGTSMEADKNLFDCDLRGPLALVLGSEGMGLRRLTIEACDFVFKIPMLGVVESLNVSVATGICLYEIMRQRISE